MPGAANGRRDAAFCRALLAWFRKNARSLPWRAHQDSYAIWVSEVMLQQTQVRTVIPFYLRFLRALPTLEHLAQAPYEHVVRLWSGLGYYRRARMLHAAAKQVEEKFAGRFPETYDEARTLPGVGHYTACAVLSMAYGKPLPVVDGNVARVMARLDTLPGNLHQRNFRQTVERSLAALIPKRHPGLFNQAMMELGQTLCAPQNPQCSACPVGRWCKARQQGKQEEYPSPKPRRASEPRHLAAAVIQKKGRVALVRGLDENLLGDLWNFPAAFGDSENHAAQRLRAKLTSLAKGSVLHGNKIGSLRHGITFRSIHVALYAGAIKVGTRSPHLKWFALQKLPMEAVSQLARKIAAEVG
ncbi:MAG TPA: A/G-specific adenine glycosylase [Terriglobia bacterium]|nr:A/G-specific adenine glycosylase [Terriglobia bacterium]